MTMFVRTLALAGALVLVLAVDAKAQQFPAGYVQGNSTASAAPARASDVRAVLHRALGCSNGEIVAISGGTVACVSLGTTIQAWDADLQALADNVTNGLWARTGSGTGAARTLTGTSNEITVANGDGVSGNPTLSLPSALTFTGKTITGGTYASPALTTPSLGVATGTSLALSGCTIGSHALCATGTSNLSGATTLGGALTYGGVTLNNAVTGTGNMVLSSSPALTTPNLGTPSAATLTNATGLPISTGVSGLGTGVATALATPSSANVAAAVTDETGSGALVFATSPTLVTPTLGAATATTINGNTFTTGTYTLTGVAGKTLTFNKSLTLEGTDSTTQTFPSSSATLAALNIEDQTLTGGARVTSKSQTAGNITIDCGDRPLQYQTNSGAFTITAPANDGSCILLSTNDGTAGNISFSGFSVGSNTGDTLTTTNGHKFMITIVRINGSATYSVKALQ